MPHPAGGGDLNTDEGEPMTRRAGDDEGEDAGPLLDEVPLKLRPRFLEIVERTDAVCDAHLTDEYRGLCRAMTAALCQEGAPVGRGKAESWAAGVVYSVGSVNFLTDPSQDPHLRAEEIAAACGVSPATMYNKARVLREGLDLSPLDPEWMLSERRKRSPLAAFGGPAPGAGDPEEVHLLEYEITEEPFPDAYLEALPSAEREAIEAVGAAALAGEAARRLPEIRTLIDRHPDHPPLRNFLCVALQTAGRGKEADAEIERTYRRFPQYLFARLNYAHRLLDADRADEVPAVFENRLALAWLYPEREGRFHVSEFLGFHVLMGQYHGAIGDYDAAQADLEMCEQIAPDHPGVDRLRTQLAMVHYAVALARAPRRGRGRRRRGPR
ncbi:DUF6398 domain-containing protein [Alienimonas sp. DA493]|uniref:DUF6398 domain-containing protein n=1 Tax=Alienimonas sp. DA493 TaxID=3373605 RepID=UPI0037545F3E